MYSKVYGGHGRCTHALTNTLVPISTPGSDTLTKWGREHTEFSLATKKAKAAAACWREENRFCAANMTGDQITAAIFALKNVAPDDFRNKQEHEFSGKNGTSTAPVIDRH